MIDDLKAFAGNCPHCGRACGSCQCARIAELEAENERLKDEADNRLYKGNSISWWWSKAKAYRKALEASWAALRAAGIEADGEKDVAAGIAELRARAERAEAACAEKDAALRKIRPALGYGHGPVEGETLGEIVDAALSTTCGERYARIVGAANGMYLMQQLLDNFGPSSDGAVERDKAAAEQRLYESLAAKEPSDA